MLTVTDYAYSLEEGLESNTRGYQHHGEPLERVRLAGGFELPTMNGRGSLLIPRKGKQGNDDRIIILSSRGESLLNWILILTPAVLIIYL